MDIELLKTKLEEEIAISQTELSSIDNTICMHIICPACKEENTQKEERRKIILENIKVKQDMINSLDTLI